MVETKKKKHPEIFPEWCKSCGICVAFCPRKVLSLKDRVIDVTNPENCISCKLCEKLCPDYAIYFEKEDTQHE